MKTFLLRINPKHVLLIVFILIYLFALSYDINKVFLESTNDFLDLTFAPAAINWLRFGPINLKFMVYFTPSIDGWFISPPYTNHPQFIVFPLWLSYKLFGIGEWQTRIVPILFSLGSFVIFWFLVDLLFQKKWLTVLSGFFYIFLPSNIYFGRMMSHEAITNFFILLSFLFVMLFRKNPRMLYFFGLAISIFIGGLVDWPMFYAVLAIWLYIIFSQDYPRKREILITVSFVAIASLSVTIFQIIIGSGFGALFNAFSRHTITGSFSWPSLIVSKIYHESLNFTSIIILWSLLGLWFLKKNNNLNKNYLFILMLVLPALIHYILFMGGISHEYWSFYFGSFMALMAAVSLFSLGISWIRPILIIYFVFSSILNTYWIFYPRTLFAKDDMDFVKNVAINYKEDGFCLPSIKAAETYLSSNFYFMKENIKTGFDPCDNVSYYILRRWDKTIENIDWNHYGILYKNWSESIKTAGLEIGTVITILKNTSYRSFLENKFANWKAIYDDLVNLHRISQGFISDRNLKKVNCSTNLCLYGK